jgi:hypothetical protein
MLASPIDVAGAAARRSDATLHRDSDASAQGSRRSSSGWLASWRRPLAAVFLIAAAALAPHAKAQHAGDILLATTPTGQLTTLGIRVYGVEFEPLELGEYVATNPGVDRATVYPAGFGTLPGRTSLSFTLEPFGPAAAAESTLWFWDGEGATANFAALTDGTQFKVSRGTSSAIVQGGTDPVEGFSLGTTSIAGSIHVHPFFILSGPSGDDPAAGVYAVSMSFSMPGRAASDPVFLLFAAPGLDGTAMPLATAWADGVAAIPEPESIALLLAGTLVVAWRVRPARARRIH